MLPLLFLAHHFSKTAGTVHGHSLHSRGLADSCDDINNCRRLFDIIWGCLTTLFACTWVSVHLNVPPPDQRWLARLWRRLRMMLITIVAPELMVGFAVRQFFVAWKFSTKFEVTFAHGFFFSMGGFVSRTGHPVTTMKQLIGPSGKQYEEATRAVKAEYIAGRGKGDALSKGIALMQGLWFITQSLARAQQHLPVTELEVATLAFAIVNIFIWLAWWEKPLDVEQPIRIGPAGGAQEPSGGPQELGPSIPHLFWRARFNGALSGNYSDPDFNPMVSTSVPSFWSLEWNNHEDNADVAVIIECLVGTVFGAIHVAAWNAEFPSADEMWMWRACSLLVTALPLLTLAMAFLHNKKYDSQAFGTIATLTLFTVIASYIIARLFLIILPFTSLRALPPGAFTDVNWSVYIPHL
ncbi:hypothetical protein DFH09DRAFT_1473573 [Mycena vulgaris]|nr:hypothetical protein DFH09DRAFT_1473573 [Mycena vulgaris]